MADRCVPAVRHVRRRSGEIQLATNKKNDITDDSRADLRKYNGKKNGIKSKSRESKTRLHAKKKGM